MRIDLVIEGPPPRKNERHEIVAPRRGRPFLKNSAAFDSFALRITNRWRRAGMPKIRAGAWSIRIKSYWARRRHLDLSTAIGDVDAPISAVLDALQECGCIDDDVRFETLTAEKYCDPENPRVEVVMEPIDEGVEQIEIA